MNRMPSIALLITSSCVFNAVVLQALYSRENPLEPERVSEKLHGRKYVLDARGGSIPHMISPIHPAP